MSPAEKLPILMLVWGRLSWPGVCRAEQLCSCHALHSNAGPAANRLAQPPSLRTDSVSILTVGLAREA